ncbi:MAG TPA: ATP-binding protein [Candidatus Dormibacteraeota bacterium]
MTLTHAAVLAGAILLADLGLYVALATSEANTDDAVLRTQASTIVAGIEDVNGQVRFGGGDLPTENQQGVAVDAAIVSRNGAIVQTPAQVFSASTLTQLAGQALKSQTPMLVDARDRSGVERRVFVETLQGQGAPAGVLVVSRSIAESSATLRRTVLFLAVFSVLIVLGGSFLAHWLTGRALLPVRRIAALARSVSQADLHRRVNVKVPPDELGELVETFNGMLARLEASFESLRRFTADASHELRSPLTIMRSELEVTRARSRTPEEYERTLDEMVREVEHMGRLVDRLLMLARADAGALHPAKRLVDASDFVHEEGARWSSAAQRSGLRVEVDAPDQGTVSIDPDLIRRSLDNLVDNAIRHAPAGSVVRLGSITDKSVWRIDVRDEGPGVPADARARIFERFARLDGARTREVGGVGLGLALSRAIVEAHGGTLDLVDEERQGATFRISLPVGPVRV